MNIDFVKAGSALLYAVAGSCLLLMLINRSLTDIADSSRRVMAGILALILLTACPAVVGYLVPGYPWILVPVTVLGVFLAGEVWHRLLRRSLTGSPPLDSTPHDIRLFRPLTTTDFACHRYRVNLSQWRGKEFRIVHLTDFHLSDDHPLSYYQDVFRVAEEVDPDLVVLTGDFLGDVKSLGTLRQLLRPLGRYGTYAVLGNHDYWMGVEDLSVVLEECGIRLLVNDEVEITAEGNRLLLTGYDYPWGTRKKEIEATPEGVIRIVLSHTPDNIYRLHSAGAHCVFSGHYHGGQFRIPFFGPLLIPSVYGRRFDHGHFVIGETHLFVASGVGTGRPAFRLYCQPDIFIVELCGRDANPDIHA